jgi:hypothetical protein
MTVIAKTARRHVSKLPPTSQSRYRKCNHDEVASRVVVVVGAVPKWHSAAAPADELRMYRPFSRLWTMARGASRGSSANRAVGMPTVRSLVCVRVTAESLRQERHQIEKPRASLKGSVIGPRSNDIREAGSGGAFRRTLPFATTGARSWLSCPRRAAELPGPNRIADVGNRCHEKRRRAPDRQRRNKATQGLKATDGTCDYHDCVQDPGQAKGLATILSTLSRLTSSRRRS